MDRLHRQQPRRTWSRSISTRSRQDQLFPIADGLSDVGNPAFDAGGKYLYFFGSTDAGPVRQWFAMSNADMEMTRNLYLVTLQKGVPSPLAKESDEEESAEKTRGRGRRRRRGRRRMSRRRNPSPSTSMASPSASSPIPVDAANYFSLQSGAENTIFYLKAG